METDGKLIFFENLDYNAKGYYTEKKVFDSIKFLFNSRNCIAKHGYIMNFLGNKFTIEADIFLLDRELGVNIFEVKGIKIENIVSINMDGWNCEGFYKSNINPNYQVDRNSVNVLHFLKENCNYNNRISVKPIIVLPYITKEQWKNRGFDTYAFMPPIIFKEDLQDKKSFYKQLELIPYKYKSKQLMNDYEYEEVKNILFGDIGNNNMNSILTEDEFLRKLLE